MGVEVIVIKFKYKTKSIIVSLKLAHHEYDGDENRIKDTKAISKMIYDAIEEYQIVPEGDANLEDQRVCQLASISSDGPYLHAKYAPDKPQIEYDIQQLLYTGPSFIG